MGKIDRNEAVLVTGGSGFLGSAVVQMLKDKGFQDILAPSSKEMNMLNSDSVFKLFRKT